VSQLDLSQLEFEELTAKGDSMSAGSRVIRKGEQYFLSELGGQPVRLTLAEYEHRVLGLRDVSTKERQSLAKKGQTFKGTSYPINNCGDVTAARQSLGRSRPQDRDALRAYINRMAQKLHCNVAPL
jgi:hypothetical protein